MKTSLLRTVLLILTAGLFLILVPPAATEYDEPEQPPAAAKNDVNSRANTLLAITPIFRFPVVPDVVVSGYFDHSKQAGSVVQYNGRRNNGANYGYYFSCGNPWMYDFVGCEYNVSGEAACPNDRELWYDGHKGIDYEFAPNWHTGAACNPNEFRGITRPIYAPAAGKVVFAGENLQRPGNGWHIILKHDVNGNGSFEDDNLRTYYLHFTANTLAVQTNQIVAEGQYLGLGGTTGYSSTPHLHFEVQRSSDNFTYNVWSVDPYGWSGADGDPWSNQNDWLWRIEYTEGVFLPAVINGQNSGGALLRNGGFESGHTDWVEMGVDTISSTANLKLPAAPYSGSWLGWLGGRNSAADTLYQTFRVPEGLSEAQLVYYLRMNTQETGGVYDQMFINLRTSNGDLIQQIHTVDNTFAPANQWLRREAALPALTERPGEQLRISFESVTDSNLITSFLVDEVSLITTAP